MAADNVTKLEDGELFEKARSHHGAAWQELMDRAAKRLMRAVKKKFPHLEPWETEEIAAAALVKTGLRMQSFDCWPRAYAYARTIALREALRWTVDTRPRDVSVVRLASDRFLTNPQDPLGDEAVAELDCADFVEALARGLPAQEHRVLGCIFAGHTSIASLSLILGVSERTARRLLARLRKRFLERWRQVHAD
jgi:DNA-directed RNA polymerase specialized sigma24 family protein